LQNRGIDNVYKTTAVGSGIISPRVIATANQYFSCSNTDNVGLENAGGSGTKGSHWDRADLGDETMTGVSINEPKYSMFTLALMEDTGWYQATYSLADDLLWGKGDGCAFLTTKC